METWNERLKQAVEKTGKNGNQIAVALKIAGSSVQAWLGAGTIAPAQDIKGEKLIRLCQFLGIRPEWLLFKEGPMFPANAKNLSPEMQELISALIEIDAIDGETRDDALYFVNRLLQRSPQAKQAGNP